MNAAAQPQDTPQSKAARIENLSREDAQFRASFALDSVIKAKRQPGLRLAQVVELVMEGYADRPALGQRSRSLVTDPATGRKTLQLLPHFDTISYRDLWTRARAVAAEWHRNAIQPLGAGDFVCILDFTSPDYAALILACIHLGAVIVPLQTSAPSRQHADIIAETGPPILAAGIDYLDAAVDAILAGTAVKRLVVMSYDTRDDDHRDRLDNARRRLSTAGRPIDLDPIDAIADRGASLPAAPLYVPKEDENPLSWLFYTSGSTGTPKGAMFTERLVIGTWLSEMPLPAITLSFMPMAHLVGNGYMLLALASGGTSYCAPKSDLSTLFEDLSLARPTMASIVPRVCELLHHHFLGEVDRRMNGSAADPKTVEAELKREMREKLLGGRLLSVGCGSASLAPETYAFMESMLDMHMPIGYSSTEIAGGTVLVDWKIQRPPVVGYKLADVPELGYFNTDKPHPRGELLVKSDRKMAGYYKRPDLTAERYDEDGYYRTGDIMAEIGPDHLIYLDRRNNVVKLSQGEFVAVSKLEALYSHSSQIRQIYIYANSERAFLLAVVVPSDALIALLDAGQAAQVKSAIRRSLQQIAEEQHLNGYEIPRDFLLERRPFSLQNGLLSEIGKHQRPKLRERYGDRLEQLYAQLAQDRLKELRALRGDARDQPVLETVTRALQATLGIPAADVRSDLRYGDLGGDSLSALQLSLLLKDIFGVEVPVGVITNPAADIAQLARYIDAERNASGKRPTPATVHGSDATRVTASDYKLEKFIDPALLQKARTLAPPDGAIRTVLLTGATGFLGRFMAVSWLERLAKTGGRLVCIARGSNAADARGRIESALASDAQLLQHFRSLGSEHLEVLPGDIALQNLGLDEATWERLASEVELIVHPAAHVNHVLPYNQLFAANVAGTAELIRLAITTRMKRFHDISTLGVNSVARGIVDEDSDIREVMADCELNDSYANGYGVSKWAGEVLLREAFDLCQLPVAVFRPGMILAHTRYAGQLNVPDMFTRLLFSLIATGVAPATFYAQDARNGRPKARYDGIPVDVLADSITAIGARQAPGFHTYNLSAADGGHVSLDDFVDWLIEAGCGIERIDSYDSWLSRFETAMQALPEERRQQSMLAILGPYRQPQKAVTKSVLPAARFLSASKAAGFEMPPLSAALINKYVADLRHLKLV
ncbi:MAG TPA: carboxylic acid reductase [Steroidobacteraceae bacterium]|nr:carboxylic acid reductase [Steroidobacteraceae bacterium]